MTDQQRLKQVEEQKKALKKVTEEATQSKETAIKYLVDAGIIPS